MTTAREHSILRRFSHPATWVFSAFLVIYGLVQTWVLISSGFYAYLNDFWILRSLADRFEFTQPSALQDGFFPYLYPFIQVFVPDSAALEFSGFLSLASALGVLWFVWATAVRIAGRWWSLIAVWVVAFNPMFFIYATVPGADLVAVLPMAAALWLLAKQAPPDQGVRLWVLFTAGLLIATGATLRYHILLFALVPLVYAVLSSRIRLRGLLATLAGILAGFLPQAIVNVSAGVFPVSTLQSFNVLRQTVGVDWNNTSELDPTTYGSVLRIAQTYPHEFLSGYLASFAHFTVILAFVAAAVFVVQGSRWSTYLWSLAAGSFVYVGATSLAFSERALIPLVPIWAISASILAMGISRITRNFTTQAVNSSPSTRAALTLLTVSVVAWTTLPWIQAAEASAVARIDLESGREQQDTAFTQLDFADDMNEVFTNDFFFYSTQTPGFVARYNDGLIRVSQRGRPMAEEVDTSGVQEFLCSALNNGIRAVVWNPGYTSGTNAELALILSGQAEHPSITSTMSGGLVFSQLNFRTDPCRINSS